MLLPVPKAVQDGKKRGTATFILHKPKAKKQYEERFLYNFVIYFA